MGEMVFNFPTLKGLLKNKVGLRILTKSGEKADILLSDFSLRFAPLGTDLLLAPYFFNRSLREDDRIRNAPNFLFDNVLKEDLHSVKSIPKKSL
jgi:hypothetical protein